MNEEAMKALRSWVKESLVDSKERNERGGYYELLDAFSSINENNENTGEEAVAKKIDESVVALVDALAEHATYVEYRAHEHLLERVTLEKCSTVSLRTCDDAYYASASQFLINLATVKGGSCVQFAMKTFVKAFFGDEKEAKKEEMLLLESRGGNDRHYRMSRFNNNNSVSGANEAAKHRERENVENRRRESGTFGGADIEVGSFERESLFARFIRHVPAQNVFGDGISGVFRLRVPMRGIR